MAKTAKVKKRQVSFHSRAARRASSPSLNLDKSAKPDTRTRCSTSPSRPSQTKPHTILAQNAGIQKKSKKVTNMTRAQRLRHQKGLEKAAEVLDKRHVKVVKSLGREKNIKERSKGWEDVNGEGKKKSKDKAKNLFGALDDDEEVAGEKKERTWVGDEEMDDVEGKLSDDVAAESVALPVEDDELL